MMYELTISSQGQIVIPSAVRKHLGIKPGNKIKMRIGKQCRVSTVTMESPTSWVARVNGIAKGIYGKGERYIENERKTWES